MFRSHLSPRKTPSKKDISPINIRLNGHYPECSSVAMGGGGSSLPIGLKSTQNRTFLVLLRSIFAQKMKTAPPKGFGSRSCGGGLADIRPKIRLNFGENLFFWEITCFWTKKPFEFWFRLGNPSQFQWRPFFFWRSPVFKQKNCLNLIHGSWQFGSRSLTVVSAFQKSPLPLYEIPPPH